MWVNKLKITFCPKFVRLCYSKTSLYDTNKHTKNGIGLDNLWTKLQLKLTTLLGKRTVEMFWGESLNICTEVFNLVAEISFRNLRLSLLYFSFLWGITLACTSTSNMALSIMPQGYLSGMWQHTGIFLPHTRAFSIIGQHVGGVMPKPILSFSCFRIHTCCKSWVHVSDLQILLVFFQHNKWFTSL